MKEFEKFVYAKEKHKVRFHRALTPVELFKLDISFGGFVSVYNTRIYVFIFCFDLILKSSRFEEYSLGVARGTPCSPILIVH